MGPLSQCCKISFHMAVIEPAAPELPENIEESALKSVVAEPIFTPRDPTADSGTARTWDGGDGAYPLLPSRCQVLLGFTTGEAGRGPGVPGRDAL